MIGQSWLAGLRGPAGRQQDLDGLWPAWDPWLAWGAVSGLLATALVAAWLWADPLAGVGMGSLVLAFDHATALLLAPLLGFRRWWIRWPVLLTIIVLASQTFAAHEFLRLRGGAFTVDELQHTVTHVAQYGFLLHLAVAGPLLPALLGALLFLVLLPWAGRRCLGPGLASRRHLTTLLAVLAAVLLAKPLLRWRHDDQPAWRTVLDRPTPGFVRYLFGLIQGPGRLRPAGVEALRTFERQHILTGPPDPALDGLHGRYPRRSVVVLFLESHQTARIGACQDRQDGRGEASPHLTAWMPHGLAFSRWYSVNYKTSAALWSLFTGLAEPEFLTPSLNQPGIAGLSPFQVFRQAGYRLAYHQGTPLAFENTGLVLEGLADDLDRTVADQKSVPTGQRGQWGLDDELVFNQVLVRLQGYARADQPVLFLVQTVAAHVPYDYPNPSGERRDHAGAMRYTDRCLDSFLRAVQDLPAQTRPLVLITSDHAYAAGLDGASLDSVRKQPGLLLTPDGFAAGRTYQALFCHLDLGALLADLLGLAWPSPTPTRNSRRAVPSKLGFQPVLILSPPWAWDRLNPEPLPLLPPACGAAGLDRATAQTYLDLLEGTWERAGSQQCP